MIVIPVGVDQKSYSLFVILEDSNIDRIKKYDPAEVTVDKIGSSWSTLKIKDVVIMYASQEEVMEISQSRNPIALLRKLSRGFVYRPELGDNDDPYSKIK